ncbi:Zinc-ribbon domain-containing protein, partial [Dysosmobacter welbionis]
DRAPCLFRREPSGEIRPGQASKFPDDLEELVFPEFPLRDSSYYLSQFLNISSPQARNTARQTGPCTSSYRQPG